METQYSHAKWLEIITVRSASSASATIISTLNKIAAEVNTDKRINAQVYACQTTNSDISLHLHHSSPYLDKPSPLGLQLAQQMRDLGAVAHSVWVPVSI